MEQIQEKMGTRTQRIGHIKEEKQFSVIRSERMGDGYK